MSNKPIRKNAKPNSAIPPKKTLDIQHTARIAEFEKTQDKLTYLSSSIANIENILLEFKEKQKHGYEASEEETLYMIQLRDEKNLLKRELEEIQEHDEIDYFTNTAPILFQYYDIVEKGTDDLQNSSIKDNDILKFFIAPQKDATEEKSATVDRASLLEKYLLLTDENYVKSIDHDLKEKCIYCGCSNRNVMLNEGMIHCNKCDGIEYIIIDHDRPSYKEIPREVTYFSYKRINHLNEFKYQSVISRLIEILRFLLNK